MQTKLETKAAAPAIPAENAVIDSAKIAAINETAANDRKAKTAALQAKRNAAKASGESKTKPTVNDVPKPDKPAEPAHDVAAERSKARELHAAFEANRLSVPVKTLAAFKLQPAKCHAIARKPSVRQAAAIAVAFSAAKTKLADGASAARVFQLDNATFAIENGCISDAISSGLISVTGTGRDEKIVLGKNAAKTIIGLIGEKLAKAGGIA